MSSASLVKRSSDESNTESSSPLLFTWLSASLPAPKISAVISDLIRSIQRWIFEQIHIRWHKIQAIGIYVPVAESIF